MSYKIANKSDVLNYCGRIPLKTEIVATVTIRKLLPNAPSTITYGQVVYILNTPVDIGGIGIYQFRGIEAAGILIGDYYPGETIDIYALTGGTVKACGKGVISMSSIDHELPTKSEVLTFWNCLLKDPSLSYDDVQLVRQEDLMEQDIQPSQDIRYYFNSAYVNIKVQNRSVVPVLNSSDTPFPQPSTGEASLNYNYQAGFCKSYIDCCVGDVITIQVKDASQIQHDAFIWDIAYDYDGFMVSMNQYIESEEDILEELQHRKKEISFQVKQGMFDLSSEYFVILSYPEFYKPIHGVWVNPIRELINGAYPKCKISVFDEDTGEACDIYSHDGTNTIFTDSHFTVDHKLAVSWFFDHNTIIPEETLITVVGDDGEVIAEHTDKQVNRGGVAFTMPKQRCTVTVTTKGLIDNSTVLSSVLNVSDYTKWSKSSSVIKSIDLVCHADSDITFKPIFSAKCSDNYDYMYEFNINIPKSQWKNYGNTINASLRISLVSTYQPSISSLLTDSSGGLYPTITVDNKYKYVTDVEMNSSHFLVKRNTSSTYDFILKLQIEKDKSYKIKYILTGEPFIIKTVETDKYVSDLTKLITGGYDGDWNWTQASAVGFFQMQYGEIYGTGYNSTVPFYTCIVPYSNIGKLPEYVTPKVFKSQYNHGLGETHNSQVVRSSELTIPSTVTTMGSVDGATVLPALQYAGFYKVSAPGLVGTIPKQCFKCNWNLQEFKVPDSVTTIEEQAFGGAGSDYNSGKSTRPFTIDLNKVQTIKEGAFAHAALIELTIPSSVTSINEPLTYPGIPYITCQIEHLTWDKKTETKTLTEIFTGYIRSSLKKLTIGKNVESLPDKFLLINIDVFQSVEYKGTKEQWESKFGDTIFQFWRGQKPITVQCSNGDITYFNS